MPWGRHQELFSTENHLSHRRATDSGRTRFLTEACLAFPSVRQSDQSLSPVHGLTCLWILELKGSQACKGFLFNFFIVSTLPSYLASRFQPEILIVFIKILILGKRELILSFSSELDRKTEAQKKEHGCTTWNLSVYGDSAIMKLGRLLSSCRGWIDSFCPLGFTEVQRLATLSCCSKHLSDCGGSSHRAPRGV